MTACTHLAPSPIVPGDKVRQPVVLEPKPTPPPPPAEDKLKVQTPVEELKRQAYRPSWERNHPERKVWTEALVQMLDRRFDNLSAAKDFARVRADYASLSRAQKLACWSEMISTMTYFESGWNPKSQSVDVGTRDNRDTWSVGLAQMSVVDQSNYGIYLGYGFNDLLDPVKNLDLAVRVMEKLAVKRGKVFIPRGENPYWSTLSPGNKHEKLDEIRQAVEGIRF